MYGLSELYLLSDSQIYEMANIEQLIQEYIQQISRTHQKSPAIHKCPSPVEFQDSITRSRHNAK